MKRTKRIFAIFMTLALAMSMLIVSSAVSFAADGDTTPTTYTITMKTTSGHTYTAYQIFKGKLSGDTLSDIQWGDGVDADNLLADLKADDTYGSAFANCSTAKAVAEVLGSDAIGEGGAEAIAKIIADNKAGNGVSGTDKIEGLEAGYYLVVDSTQNMPQGQTYSDFILKVVKNVEVEAKDGTVTSEKKVADNNDSQNVQPALTDVANSAWQDSADYDIGDNVPFMLKGVVGSDYDNYGTYKFVFHDVESNGLTFNEDAKVYVDGTEIKSGFTVVTEGLTDGCTFEVRFADLKQIQAVHAGSVITVKYTSELNEDANIGSAGNPNTMHIEYSNNPNSEQTGTTKDDTVIVFTYKVVANKIKEDESALEGAKFELFKKVKGEPEAEGGEPTESWISLGEIEGAGNKANTFTWEGIDDGDYKIVETQTPAGYNTIDPIEFTVTADHDVLSDNPALNSLNGGELFTGEASTGQLTADIINESGATLPSTGGIGTVIFYVLGSLLVVGCGIVLISKRRMESK